MFDDWSSDEPEEAVHTAMNRLRGRLCGLIESWNLPDKQERGAIATLKTLTYDIEENLIKIVSDEVIEE